jgi:hypothetical protein
MMYGLAVARLDTSRRSIMRKILTSALVALSVLGGVATVANASPGEEFGAKTAPGQVPSPN